MTSINEEFYDDNLNFTETQGLSFAFALSNKPDISYAEIKYYVSEWNYEIPTPYSVFYELESHNCT